jgi:tetratricopeptide (TPR) repeat protein
MAGMDKVIAKVVAGTYDAKKEAELEQKAKAIEGQLRAAYEGERWDEMLALLEKLGELRPEAKGQMGFTRVAITLIHKKDFAAGYALAEQLGAGDLKDDAQGLNQIAWFILDTDEIEKRDYAVALKLAARAAEVSKNEDPAILDTLARAHFENKQIDKAIEVQTRAVALSAKVEDPEMRDELAQTLEKYKKAKGRQSEEKKD